MEFIMRVNGVHYQCTVIECMELMLVAWTEQKPFPLEYMIDELVVEMFRLEAM